MVILGIDPGFAIVGFGILEVSKKCEMSVIDYGVIETKKEETINERIYSICGALNVLIDKYKPDNIVFEELFFHSNAKTVINVAQARGAMLLTATNKIGIDGLYEYTPLQIKQAITGYGRADKQQMQQMVKMLLKLKSVPKPDDAADALAVAICHAQTSKFAGLFKVNR